MEKCFLPVILLVIYVFQIINTSSTFLMKKSEFDNKIIRDFVLEQVYSETLTTCVYRCVYDLGCVSLFYNQNQKSCQMNTVLFITPGDGIEEIGTRYYSLYEEGCPADFIRNRKLGLCYKPYIETYAESFGVAKNICLAGGYVLVRGKTVEAYTHITNQLVSSTDYNSKNFMIDGSDADVEGVWKFENGENMTAFVWAEGEPDNNSPSKDYVYLKESNGVYEMSDTQFDLDAYYICQML